MIQLFAELNMLRKLFASIWSDRQVWLSPERFTHYLVYSSSGFSLCLATKQISTLSVYQRNKASLALLSYYSICFPMTTNGAVFRAGRAFLNSMRYDKLPTTFLRTFFMTPLSVVTQLPKDVLWRCPIRIQNASMDSAIDCRYTDHEMAILQLNAPSNLFW
jgi:hypothetical protein